LFGEFGSVSVGFCFLRTDKKYSFIDVVAAMKPKTKDIDLRIEKNKLYLRFDKQKAYLGECKLMDGDDVVRVVVNFKVFVSKNKEEKVKERVLKELGIEE